jgi:hypothetical protein
MDQISDGGKNVHGLGKTRKHVELEKEELQAVSEEVESTLEQEKAKVLHVQMELSAIHQEIVRRVHEKEEEFENTRRNHAHALESVQASLEAEALKQVRKKISNLNQFLYL